MKTPILLIITIGIAYIAASFAQESVSAQREDTPPFQLPFAEEPGPDTWLLGQAYGNTSGAYRQRTRAYAAGQGLHFGIDLDLFAVIYIDGFSFFFQIPK